MFSSCFLEMFFFSKIIYFINNFCVLDQDRFLAYSPGQNPIVLQIGGSNLDNVAKATELAMPYDYDEINFKYVSRAFIVF